jgi:hypothetical protein
MDNVTRREVVGVAALALAALTPTQASADDKPKPTFDEKAERQRVIACGMTEAEADCWVAVAQAAGKFFELPKLHVMDEHEVAHAIHVVQHKLLSRPAYRKYLELAKAEKK